MIFVLAAVGCSAAGALWLASLISFQPKTYFSVQWTAYGIFTALLGGLGYHLRNLAPAGTHNLAGVFV
jgi:branched-chain amino acid transport system permease protein